MQNAPLIILCTMHTCVIFKFIKHGYTVGCSDATGNAQYSIVQ